MKTAFYFIIFTFLPIFLVGQVDFKKVKLSKNVQDSILGTDIVLKNDEVVFAKKFISDLSKEKLIEKIKIDLKNTKSIELNKGQEIETYLLNGNIIDYPINHIKYNISPKDIFSKHPLQAIFKIEIQDFEYKVTISKMHFKNVSKAKCDFYLENFLIIKGNKLRKTAPKVGYILQNELCGIFNSYKL